MTFPDGSAARRVVAVLAVLAVGFLAAPVAIAAAGGRSLFMSMGSVGATLAVCAVIGLLIRRGGSPSIDREGVRLKAFGFDRSLTLVPWPEVDAVWLAQAGWYPGLFVRPRDPERFRGGGFRGWFMRYAARRQGSEMVIGLRHDRAFLEQVCVAVHEYSGGRLLVTAGPG